jgi:hypothetical protein
MANLTNKGLLLLEPVTSRETFSSQAKLRQLYLLENEQWYWIYTMRAPGVAT